MSELEDLRAEVERLHLSGSYELAGVEVEAKLWKERCLRAEADAEAAGAETSRLRVAIRDFADCRGVYVGDEDGDWYAGYRQAQREALQDAAAFAEGILGPKAPVVCRHGYTKDRHACAESEAGAAS